MLVLLFHSLSLLPKHPSILQQQQSGVGTSSHVARSLIQSQRCTATPSSSPTPVPSTTSSAPARTTSNSQYNLYNHQQQQQSQPVKLYQHEREQNQQQTGTLSLQNPLDTLLDELQTFSKPVKQLSESLQRSQNVTSSSSNVSSNRIGNSTRTGVTCIVTQPTTEIDESLRNRDKSNSDNRSNKFSKDVPLSYMRAQIESILERNADKGRGTRIQDSLSPSGLELGASAASMAASKNSLITGSDSKEFLSKVNGRHGSHKGQVSRLSPTKPLIPNSVAISVHSPRFDSINSSAISAMLAMNDKRLFKPLSAEMLLGHSRPPSLTDHILNVSKPQSANDFTRRSTFNFDSPLLWNEEYPERRLSLTDTLFKKTQPGGIGLLENTRASAEQLNSKVQSVQLPMTPLTRSSNLTGMNVQTLPKAMPSHQGTRTNVSKPSKPIPPPLSTHQQSPLLNIQPLLTAIPPTPTSTVNSPTPVLSEGSRKRTDSLTVGNLPGNLSATGFLGAGVIIRDGIIVRRLPSFPSSDSQASTSPVKGQSPPTSPMKLSPPHTPRRIHQRFIMPASFSTSSEGRDSPLLPPRHDPHKLPPPPPPRNVPRSPMTSPKGSKSPSYKKSHSPTKNTFQYPSPKSLSPARQSALRSSCENLLHTSQMMDTSSSAQTSRSLGHTSSHGGTVVSIIDGIPRNAEGRQLYGPVLKQRPPLPRGSLSEESTTSTVSSTSTKSAKSTPDTSSSVCGIPHMGGVDSRSAFKPGLGIGIRSSNKLDKVSSTSSSTESVNSQEPLSSRGSMIKLNDTSSFIAIKNRNDRRNSSSPHLEKKINKASVQEYADVLNQLSGISKVPRDYRNEDKEDSGSRSSTPRMKPEARQKQEILEQRHVDLLRRQKQLQEQYERLQNMQKTGNRLSAPNMDSLQKELVSKNSKLQGGRNKREFLKKTGSENNLLSRSGLSVAPPDASGSMTNLLSVQKSQFDMRSSTGTISVKNTTNVNKPCSPTSILSMDWSAVTKPTVTSTQNSPRTIVVGTYSSSSVSLPSTVNNSFRQTSGSKPTVTTKILGSNLSSSRKTYTPKTSSSSSSSTKKSSVSITLAPAPKTVTTTMSTT